jgi:D-tyrosyl-tRNA(Tyr) deacylase
MRCVVQRVSRAQVDVGGETVGKIGPGLVALVGVAAGDGEKDAQYLADKLANLRVFEDAQGKMNLSVLDTGGAILAVSQFTLLGDARGGRRPSFIEAARPKEANALYEVFLRRLRETGIGVETGVFQAEMAVSLVNDGPVTLLLDSRKQF